MTNYKEFYITFFASSEHSGGYMKIYAESVEDAIYVRSRKINEAGLFEFLEEKYFKIAYPDKWKSFPKKEVATFALVNHSGREEKYSNGNNTRAQRVPPIRS
jgi:hypothetical protein